MNTTRGQQDDARDLDRLAGRDRQRLLRRIACDGHAPGDADPEALRGCRVDVDWPAGGDVNHAGAVDIKRRDVVGDEPVPCAGEGHGSRGLARTAAACDHDPATVDLYDVRVEREAALLGQHEGPDGPVQPLRRLVVGAGFDHDVLAPLHPEPASAGYHADGLGTRRDDRPDAVLAPRTVDAWRVDLPRGSSDGHRAPWMLAGNVERLSRAVRRSGIMKR